MFKVVLFYRDELRLDHRDNVFGWRFTTQPLPPDVVVCGLIVDDEELLSPPTFLTTGQWEAWHYTLGQARSWR